jgi:hypothetical protein
MLLRHSFALVALNFLLQAHYAFGQQEDHTTFETEFRLMIMTGDPDHIMVTVENQDGGGESEGRYEDIANINWHSGVDARSGDGNFRLSYMGWSRPSPNDRHVWIHQKGTDKESGKRVSHVCIVKQDTSLNNSALST